MGGLGRRGLSFEIVFNISIGKETSYIACGCTGLQRVAGTYRVRKMR